MTRDISLTTHVSGSCVCGLSISSPRPCSWTQEQDSLEFQEVEVFCLSSTLSPVSVSNSLLVEASPDYTVTAVVLLLAATSFLTLACTR